MRMKKIIIFFSAELIKQIACTATTAAARCNGHMSAATNTQANQNLPCPIAQTYITITLEMRFLTTCHQRVTGLNEELGSCFSSKTRRVTVEQVHFASISSLRILASRSPITEGSHWSSSIISFLLPSGRLSSSLFILNLYLSLKLPAKAQTFFFFFFLELLLLLFFSASSCMGV